MKFLLKSKNIFLYATTLSVNLASFAAGGSFGWSSPAIPKLNGQLNIEDNPLKRPINQQEESWIASLLMIGAAIGCFIAGYLSDRIGRKRTLLLFALPTIIGFVVNSFATKVTHFYLGRILNGFGIGAVYAVTPIYLGEIAEKSNRGLVSCFCMLMVNVGTVFSFAIGPYVSIKTLGLSNTIAPILFLITFGLVAPESPYYLVLKNKLDEAQKSLTKLRCTSNETVRQELSEISKNAEEAFANKSGGARDLFCAKTPLKAFCITSGLVVFQQMSGVNFIFFYMQSIFEKTGSGIPSDLSVIIIGLVLIVAVIIASVFVDSVGRKLLLLFSGAGMGGFALCFGAYFYLKEPDVNVDYIYLLPVLSIIFYVFFYAIGFGPVPFALIGEIFPSHVKSLAATLSIFTCLMGAFCATTFFPLIVSVIGMAYMFFMCGIFCCASVVFVCACVPETKGKSFLEIQNLLNS